MHYISSYESVYRSNKCQISTHVILCRFTLSNGLQRHCKTNRVILFYTLVMYIYA